MGTSDEALLAGLATGDRDASAAFVRRFQRRAYGLARTIVGDPGTAEDVAQEAFVRAWRYAASYDARRGTVLTWLLTIVRNLAVDRIRVRQAEPIDPELLESKLRLGDDRSAPDEQAAFVEGEQVRTALTTLPEEQRLCRRSTWHPAPGEEHFRSTSETSPPSTSWAPTVARCSSRASDGTRRLRPSGDVVGGSRVRRWSMWHRRTPSSVWYSCRAMTVRRLSIWSAAVVASAAVAASVASAAASPPHWIVFSGHPDGSGIAQLFRVGLDGSGLKQITTGKLPATAPSFSPDGRQIVFTRLGSGIFRVSVDGTGLRRLSSGPRDSYPVWSPDGKTIAFLRPYQALWRVYVMSASGAGKQRLGFPSPAGRPSWSANSKTVLVPAAGSLASIDAKTGKVKNIFGALLNPETAQSVTVSPNGRTVTWVDARTSTGPPDCGEGRCPQFALYRSDVSGKNRRRIANDTGPAGWSPDGRRLVFLLQGSLTVFDVASGTKTKLNTGSHTAAGDAPPAWQPR